MQKVQVDVV